MPGEILAISMPEAVASYLYDNYTDKLRGTQGAPFRRLFSLEKDLASLTSISTIPALSMLPEINGTARLFCKTCLPGQRAVYVLMPL